MRCCAVSVTNAFRKREKDSSDRHILPVFCVPRVTPRAVGDVSFMLFAVNVVT